MARIALAWVLGRPEVTAPIVGTTSAAQLEDALAGAELELSAEEVETLESGYTPHPVVGFS
jgi:aryl-alcohol dehydrogenase (NADP+)